MSWRKRASPTIAAVLEQYPDEGSEQRNALKEAYPFGIRAYHPYKVWLDEIARQKGKKIPLKQPLPEKNEAMPGQMNLQECC